MTQAVLHKIKSQFASLQLEVRLAMEKQEVDVNNVHQYLVSLFQGCCIPEVPHLTKLFNIITEAKLWSYDHYGPLEELAEKFLPSSDAIRALVDEYRDKLSGFCTTTKIIDFVNLSEEEESEDEPEQSFSPQKYKKYYRKLKIKLKLDKKITEPTLSYVNTLWRSLAKEFDLPTLTAVLDKIVGGSLVISWLVFPNIAEKIRASVSKALQFYQLHNIVELYIDNDLLYSEEWTVSTLILCVI